jgi:hypothetical protein
MLAYEPIGIVSLTLSGKAHILTVKGPVWRVREHAWPGFQPYEECGPFTLEFTLEGNSYGS